MRVRLPIWIELHNCLVLDSGWKERDWPILRADISWAQRNRWAVLKVNAGK
jgi:hypothetical protein